MMASSTEKKKVCVVGAGVSGLVSARELRREGHDVTVMEQSSGVGGQWLYDPRTDASDPLGSAGVHSGVYASLRLNSPRDSMSLSDFPFYPKSDGTGDARRYPGHAEFLRYIRDFCDAFGLMDAVMLNTKVLHVGLAPPRTTDDDGLKRWMVRWSRRGDCEGEVVTTEEEFDAVIVASGHYSQPMLPAINGMDKWRRRQLHSHSYRVPDSFHDEVVVVVGLSESGKEIALELRQVAREVHVSVKSMDGGAIVPGMRKALSRHHNLHLHLQIECLCEDGQVTFADGSCVVADSIIYCTGYDYSFPFLDTGGLLTVDDNRVGPLFEHTFPPALAPSLSFVGVPKLVLVPRFFEVQARWVAQVLSGRKPLPSSHEMLRSVEEYHRTREMAGVPRRLSHALFFDLEYCDEFGEKRCGFPRLQEWKKEAMRAGVASLVDDTESFRDDYHDSDLVLEGLRSEGWSYCSQTLNVKENGVDMMMASSTKKKKVCVVGAGVSGLVSARELLREGHDVTVMEQSSGVGGQWLYDPRTDASDALGAAGVHSGVYASLRLTSPRDIMGFSDFPFFPSSDGGSDARRYPGHAEFLRFIRDFCDAFGLMDVVRLNTKVLHVGPLAPPHAADAGTKRWTVRCANANSQSQLGRDEGEEVVVVTEEVFDAVVVASGHYSQPRLPTIKAMDRWRRRQLHSHSYRVPDSFHGEVVVLVGFHQSGVDIALELSTVANEVHVSVKSMEGLTPGVSKAVSRHHNLHLHLQIECLCEDGQVMFNDGFCVVADSIIYCTGYDFSFPFLDTGGLVTVDDNRVGPLYEHTFPPALAPSLSFVGVPSQVQTPLFYEVQARWVAQVLSGRRPLPSSEEMMRCTDEYHRAREEAGVPRRLSHAIFFDFEYCDEFGDKTIGFPRPPEWKKELMRAAVARLVDDTESFRDDYRDGDLVLEGLRSEGWYSRPVNDKNGHA